MITTTNLEIAKEALAELVTSYHELNGNHIDELEQPPSPLLFMQYVARNRPFVVRKAAVNWPAVSLWSPDYLTSVMGDSTVRVAVTPSGSEIPKTCVFTSRVSVRESEKISNVDGLQKCRQCSGESGRRQIDLRKAIGGKPRTPPLKNLASFPPSRRECLPR